VSEPTGALALDDLFDRRLSFPDSDARARFSRLVGIDGPKERMCKLLGILSNPEGAAAWGRKHHRDARQLIDYVQRMPPLVVFAGDVGTGKTELAETIGDAVARQEGHSVTLYPMSLSTRGSGRVGEMTKLIAAAFDAAVTHARRLKRASGPSSGSIILLIDEADALAQSRENSQMHHEDRAGVNALIRGIDRFAEARLPAVVILCTNRLSALDPAVRRRAADIFAFTRPNDEQRRAVLTKPLQELGFSPKHISELVTITGPGRKDGLGFTFSDLTQRLLPSLVIDAYPDKPVTFQRAAQVASMITPTPAFRDS